MILIFYAIAKKADFKKLFSDARHSASDANLSLYFG